MEADLRLYASFTNKIKDSQNKSENILFYIIFFSVMISAKRLFRKNWETLLKSHVSASLP